MKKLSPMGVRVTDNTAGGEMRQLMNLCEGVVPSVTVKEKVRVDKEWVCPHCNEEIGEKSLYRNERDEYFHRSCMDAGPITLTADD